jgi:hypothetical protein
VADYANRLGLAQPGKAPHAATCTFEKTAAAPVPVMAPHKSPHGAPQTIAQNAGPIMVRNSVVHAIDAAPAMQQAVWSAVPRRTSGDVPAELGKGASDCLSIESDGANLGFRNQCGYGVSFAYCLQTAMESDASCDAGSKLGNVSANGFTPVVFDANIKPADAEHDFRWVACSGGASDVTPHLDKFDPPAGRCVRVKSS